MASEREMKAALLKIEECLVVLKEHGVLADMGIDDTHVIDDGFLSGKEMPLVNKIFDEDEIPIFEAAERMTNLVNQKGYGGQLTR